MSGSSNYHARKSPSDSKRWLRCTNSVAYERMFKLAVSKTRTKEETAEMHELLARFETSFDEASVSGYQSEDVTEFNAEGTRAHDWAEKVLKGMANIEDVPEARDMRSAVASYVEECHRLEAESQGMGMFIEEQVPLFYDTDETGTMDFAVASQDRVDVLDYKHGIGIYVEAFENPQLAIYGLSFMRWLEEEGYFRFDPDTVVRIRIHQPRHRLWDPSHQWLISYHDLKAFGREIQKKADEVDSGNGVFAPSDDTCHWCKLKAFCGARRHHIVQGMPTMPPDGDEIDFLTDLPDFKERGAEPKFDKAFPSAAERLGIYTMNYPPLTNEQKVKIWSNKKGITKFLEDVTKDLTQQALGGNPVGGTKLVNGNPGDRKWASEDAGEAFLVGAGISEEDRYYPLEILSVPDAEKFLGDKVETKKKKNPARDEKLIQQFKAAVFRSPAKPVLALEDDPRESAVANLDGFDIIEDGDDFIEA